MVLLLIEYINTIIYVNVGLRVPLNKGVTKYTKTSSIDQHDEECGMGDEQPYATRV